MQDGVTYHETKTFDRRPARLPEFQKDNVEFLQSLTAKPQTAENYASHLAAIFATGRPMWGCRSFDRADAVEAAMRLFRRRGYEGVSVADLTKAIGIAPPSLYAALHCG